MSFIIIILCVFAWLGEALNDGGNVIPRIKNIISSIRNEYKRQGMFRQMDVLYVICLFKETCMS